MHPSDVLVIGPLHPHGSRTLRLPIRNMFIAGLAVAVGTAVAVAIVVVPLGRQQSLAWFPDRFASSNPAGSAETIEGQTFEVDSTPTGAKVRFDGHDFGRTPANISLPAGKTV